MRYIYSLPEETSKRSFENSAADIRWATLLHGITTVSELYGMHDIINTFNDYCYGNKHFIKITRHTFHTVKFRIKIKVNHLKMYHTWPLSSDLHMFLDHRQPNRMQ